MIGAGSRDSALRALVQAIVVGDGTTAARILANSPELARERAGEGATRQIAEAHYLDEIEHYLYAGDTALHIAAAAYQKGIAMDLIARGADVRARNRRGAEPLHYAADGVPASHAWNPHAQEATIACLIEAGADPNAVGLTSARPIGMSQKGQTLPSRPRGWHVRSTCVSGSCSASSRMVGHCHKLPNEHLQKGINLRQLSGKADVTGQQKIRHPCEVPRLPAG